MSYAESTDTTYLDSDCVSSTVFAEQPIVFFFLIDDLGPDELVYYASKFHETPDIDALASRGMRFPSDFSGSTLCSRSRASIPIGRHPARLHLTDWIPGQTQINVKSIGPDWKTHIDGERALLPEALKERGYATGFFGKWDLMPKPNTRIWESNDKKGSGLFMARLGVAKLGGFPAPNAPTRRMRSTLP